MARVGIIGTVGVTLAGTADRSRTELVATRWGDVPVQIMALGLDEVVFLRRSGKRFPLEPGRINYRANLLAFVELGVTTVLATCLVGSVRRELGPGTLVNLDQLLDFTRHRPPTLFDDSGFRFTDMSYPYCTRVRSALAQAASQIGANLLLKGCYVGVDGPRFETAAEVRMFGILGGDVIGHTGTTEAILAREAGLCYGSVAMVSNYGAGIGSAPLSSSDMAQTAGQYANAVGQLVTTATQQLQSANGIGCECGKSAGNPQISAWSRLI